MPLHSTLRSTLAALQDYIQDQLNAAPYASTFALFPPRVILLEAEPSLAIQAGLPVVVLTGTDDQDFTWGKTARRAVVEATVRASEFTGTWQGQGVTDTPVQAALSDALLDILRTGYKPISQLGLIGVTTRRLREGTTGATDAPMHTVEHEIQFHFYTA